MKRLMTVVGREGGVDKCYSIVLAQKQVFLPDEVRKKARHPVVRTITQVGCHFQGKFCGISWVHCDAADVIRRHGRREKKYPVLIDNRFVLAPVADQDDRIGLPVDRHPFRWTERILGLDAVTDYCVINIPFLLLILVMDKLVHIPEKHCVVVVKDRLVGIQEKGEIAAKMIGIVKVALQRRGIDEIRGSDREFGTDRVVNAEAEPKRQA